MDPSEYEKIMNLALRFVSVRPRSEMELQQYVEKKTDEDEVVQKVMDRLADLGYADDNKFASWWVSARQGSKPKGFRVIGRELSAKGVSREIIEKALVLSEGTELARAKRAISPKVTLWNTLSKIERNNKIFRYLTYRGYSPDTIRKLIDDSLIIDYNTDV